MSVKRWSINEERDLVTMIKAGKTYDEIGTKLNRSPSAIKMRIETIIYNNIINGRCVDDIAKKMHMSKDNVIQMYIIHKNFKMSRGEKVVDVNVISQSTKTKQNKHDTNVDAIVSKLERENKILELIVKNCELKERIRNTGFDKKINIDVNKLFDIKL